VSVTSPVSLRDLHIAWREARRGKKPSADQAAFDADWPEHLIELEAELNALTWSPAPPTCFIAKAPKAREIHAPAFIDRVVHHYLVPRLETIYEPVFIHDSFSNRKGKGTHAAVDRLQEFVREVHSGEGGGWFLQLDIRNFFNSIHRPTLWELLRDRMERHGFALPIRHTVHALLRHSPLHHGAHYACRPEERPLVPVHKRLENAAPGCGIAIGNLSSQFFANVYLDRLDQFVKHQLKAKRYVRFVDDFVLVHHDRGQLATWLAEIEHFLAETLRLELKPDRRLSPLTGGCDFLGYVIFPTHRLVRRRVIAHCRSKLAAWERRHITAERRPTRAGIDSLRSTWSSYLGHFKHSTDRQIIPRLLGRFPWMPNELAR